MVGKLNNEVFKEAKSILMNHLDENIKIIDLCCGESDFTDWLKKEDKYNFISLTPEKFKHIQRENSFVAYNNFVNDERLMPTDNKADAILLMGPLYQMQNKPTRLETLQEVKRLLSPKGKIFTLSTSNSNVPTFLSATTKEEKQQLEQAGFKVETVENINTTEKASEVPNAYVTVASIKPIPKPVLSASDIPPEVIIKIPKRKFILKESIDKSLTLKKEKLLSPVITEKRTLHNIYNSLTEVKPSIDISLQRNIKGEIKRSIDPTLQPSTINNQAEQKGIKMDLPILPKVILDEYNISSKEIKPTPKEEIKVEENEPTVEEKSFEKPVIPLKPSIDKSLVVRENKDEIIKEYKKKAENRKVHKSIDKSLQMRIPKINPKYAKPKSRKKGIKNLIKPTELR